MPPIFPFTAIVGQERMKRALVLNAVNPRIGGVLIRGERGTAKSTAARALAALLPEVRVVADCRFGCDPDKPGTWCTECKERFARSGEPLPVTTKRTSFVNLPVSATEDRVVGTLDIEKAIKQGERHFEPGVLAAANRGLLYIDEVNLLDDHVVDLLLDSAAMGVNVVEREGISFAHPARFILVGTMNPEEGDLRPQLLDRFALSVEIHGLAAPADRMAIMDRTLDFEADPDGFRAKWLPKEQELGAEIERGREMVDAVGYSKRDLHSIAALTSSLQVDGHRADLVILKAARAHAALNGRKAIGDTDIAVAAELALPHRIKRGPFQQAEVNLFDLEERIEQIRSEFQGDEGEPQPAEENGPVKKKQGVAQDSTEETPDFGQAEAQPQQTHDTRDAYWWEGGQKVKTGESFDPRKLDTPLDKLTRKAGGKRSVTRTDRKRGRYIQARPAHGKTNDLAFDATLRAAAPMQQQRQKQRDEHRVAFAVQSEDFQRKIRVKRASNLILFVVDASWSMAVAERMSATKGAIMSLLTDAYQRRDRVGLIVFQKNKATLVLPPTNSVHLAQHALSDIPVGGKTPLSAGLTLADKVFEQEKRTHPDVMPLMILLTDGAGNVALTDLPPQEEAHRAADLLRENHIRGVVINMEHAAFDQGLARTLAERLGAPCYTLRELKAESLYQTVKEELGGGK